MKPQLILRQWDDRPEGIFVPDDDLNRVKKHLKCISEGLRCITPIGHEDLMVFNRLRTHLLSAGEILSRHVMPECAAECANEKGGCGQQPPRGTEHEKSFPVNIGKNTADVKGE